MLDILRRQQTDIVVASRYVASGAADGLSAKRRMLSRAGVRLARVLLKSDITDPVSGFFMMRSEVVEKAAARLSGVGTKILIDLLSSSPSSLLVAELPYRFRGRYSGSSKLDWLTVLEYLALLAEKVSGRYLPSKFLLFGLVGASGVVVHLVVLRVFLASAGTGFCRRPIGCDGNRDGLELLPQQHLDLSRLPARRLGGIAWSPLLYGDLRPRCRRQRPGGSRLVRNLPALAVPRSERSSIMRSPRCSPGGGACREIRAYRTFGTMHGWGIVARFRRARETAMFEAEARWLRGALDMFPAERLSPLLNLGSSSADIREVVQPWIEDQLFRPLRTRGVEVVHVDMRELPGVDVQADLTDPDDVLRLSALRPGALLCCNLLEHVIEPDRLADHCLNLLAVGGLVFVTVPFSYPYHRDPIETMYRPSPSELSDLFTGTRLLDGTILGMGESYRDAVRERPWLLLRHVSRFPVPFLSVRKWKRSMARLYWLAAEYRITCAVFEKI